MPLNLTPSDASLLALVAEHPGMSDEMLDRVLKMTQSARVKKIIRALNSPESPEGSIELRKTVRGLKLWAERNRLVHGAPEPLSKRRRSG